MQRIGYVVTPGFTLMGLTVMGAFEMANRTSKERAYQAVILSEHGGPVRLYVAPMFGYKSLKWLSAIKVVDQVVPGYWEQNGYSQNAWIGSSNGRSDQPVD